MNAHVPQRLGAHAASAWLAVRTRDGSRHLTKRFGRGFGRRNLFQMKAFYLAYPEIVQTASAQSSAGETARKVQTDDEGESGADTDRLGLLRLVAAVAEGLVDRALFDRVGEKIAARQTRTPTPRPEREGTVDPFLLRGLLVCARCGKRMTTSSTGKVERLPISPPPPEMPSLRYYRCRGKGCPKSQMPASAIEALVPKLFATPAPEVSAQTRVIFEHVARIWDNLIVPNRRRELVSLCKEIRWDGEHSKLTIIADEVGIANWVESWRRIHAREAAAAASC